MIPSFVLLNKEAGISSFQAMNQLKKDIGTKRVGHCGTLDPFADGLLLALTGRITKFMTYMSDMSKVYEAHLRFGEETDTLDPTGKLISQGLPIPDLEAVEKAAASFSGDIMQVPPSFSAVHVDGKRAYKLARRGAELDIPAKKVTIYSFEIIEYRKPDLRFRVTCSGGTYIRAIARDLAAMCGTKGYLTELRRTAIGPFSLQGIEMGSYKLLPASEGMALCGVATQVVPRTEAEMLKAGREFTKKFSAKVAPFIEEGIYKALFDEEGDFCAMVGKRRGRLYYEFAAGVN
ncbi:MAG: tRNA pseudouridine(55) synthase TruB [Spirochaetia bacterium]|nr:tRNA pseudouridine(55) synthase TruB [Spirochaetia bacterium]